jgi:gamma-glutamylcyclotransferase (GGCT)/AIG2-like uncharacterized protein YtfP
MATATITGPNPPVMIQIFVYGTLKRGYWNHASFCAHAQHIEPATVWGRLYDLDYGFPGLQTPDSTILAQGTNDPLADANLQARLKPLHFERPVGDWDLVHGELVTLSDPIHDLPPIDQLEDFRPGEQCLYQRVLTASRTDNKEVPVWLYRMKSIENGVRLHSGIWESRDTCPV